MITVYTFGPAWEVPDLSPFVTKLLTWLRMAGAPHVTAIGDVRKAPKRKLPYIDDGGLRIGDSSLIIDHLVLEGRAARLPGDDLSRADAAIATAFKGMIESELYFVLLWARWVDDAAFAMYRPVLVQSLAKMGVPAIVGPALTRYLRHQMREQTLGQGIGRHDRGTIFAMGRRHIDAISDHLAEKPYFMGAEPGTIDATVFAFLDTFTGTPLTPALGNHVRSRENLVRYCARMRERYWSSS